MRKKLLSMLLVLCFVLTLLPVTAGAANATSVIVGGVDLTYTDTPVYATTNSSGVVTTAGATADNYNIKFENGILSLKDATIAGALHSDGLTSYGIYVPSVVNLSIDLSIDLEGVNTVSSGSVVPNYSYGINVGGALTVSGNGSLTATAGAANTSSYGISAYSLAISSGTVNATAGTAGSISKGVDVNGVLIVSGGSLTATAGTAGSASSGVSVGGALTVYGSGSIDATAGEAEYGIGSSSGVSVGGALTVFDSGSIDATAGTADNSGGNSYGVRASKELTVSDSGSLTAEAKTAKYSHGVYVREGLTVYGSGSLTATAGTAASGSSKGINAVFCNCTIYGNAQVNASGGGGGDSKGISVSTDKNITIKDYAVVVAKSGTGSNSQAISKPPTLTNYTGVCAVTASADASGTPRIPYTAGNNSSYKYIKVKPATRVDDATALNSAISHVAEGDFIALGNNITLTSTRTINSEYSLIIDLNGKTLDGGTNTAIENAGSGTLTIIDSSTGSNGKVTSAKQQGEGTISLSSGNLIVSGGTVQNTAEGTTGYAIYNNSSGSVTVSGGTVSADGTGGCAINHNSTGSITVSSGTVSANGVNGQAINNRMTGSVSVSGGTVSADGTNGCAIYNASTGGVSVSGGTVSANGTGGYAIHNTSNGSISINPSATITGGLYPLTATPEATTTSVAKTDTTQTSVSFSLINDPVYPSDITWLVYNASTGGSLVSGVTAYHTGNTLTLTGINLPTATYHVAAYDQANGKGESSRLALTVAAGILEVGDGGTYALTETGLNDAIDAANNGDTIKFKSSGTITLNADIYIDKSITLDLNGKTINFAGEKAVILPQVSPVSVTIQGPGTISTNSYTRVYSGSTLTVQGGAVIEGTGPWQTLMNYGTVSMTDGTLRQTNGNFVLQNEGTATFDDVTIETSSASNPVIWSNNGTLTLNNNCTTRNNFTGTTSGTLPSVILVSSSAAVTLNGGSVTAPAGSTKPAILVHKNATLTNNGAAITNGYVTKIIDLSVSVSSGAGKVTLAQQTAEPGVTYYYKTTAADDTAAKPSYDTAFNSAGWTAFSTATDIATANTATVYVQVVKVGDSTHMVYGWGQGSTIPTVTSAAPVAATSTVSKTAAAQASVSFTLTNSPAYANGQTWSVYSTSADTVLVEGVTATNTGNVLTLTHATDLPAGTYYLAVTETNKIISERLALTVGAYVPETAINISAVAGVTPPAAGAAPVTTITECDQYTGTVAWSGNPSAFGYSTAYTATITLTPKSGYTLTGVAANFFTVSGAESVSNNADSGVVTAVFPATGSASGGGSYTPPAPVTEIKNGSTTTASNITALVSNGKTLTVEADKGAKLVFDTDSLKGISGQTSGSIQVEMKDVSPSHQENLPGKQVFSLTVSSGGKTISSFGGAVTVSLPYDLKEGERADEVSVWHLASDGTMTEIPCTYDPVTKLASFTVTHFSMYVVGVTGTTPWTNPFTDLSVSDWFYGAVEFVNSKGLFAGTGAYTFSPDTPMNRAMLWTVLGRLDGQTLSGSGVFESARSWAMNAGITDGSNPDGYISREQMVTILWRYAGSPKTQGNLSSFSDAGSVADYAADAMAWAVENSIIGGENGALMPQDSATRAQVAAILQRYISAMK